MKTELFRTVEFWKSAFISMSDNSFFELMRSVFGKIKTPFNKQQLLNDLENFLLRKDIQETLTVYIDETDSKIIKAVALFGEPVLEQLKDFFSDELNYAELLDKIINLEERLIIYRFSEEKTSYLALNPVLKQILLPITANIASLFPTVNEKKSSAGSAEKQLKAEINDLTIAALNSFIFRYEIIYKPDNTIRKKIADDAKTMFPDIDLQKVFGAMQVLGLFYQDNENLLADKKRFDDFSLRSSSERMVYLTAALLIYSSLTPPIEILPPLFRVKIREYVDIIHRFLNSLKADSSYIDKTLKRMIEVFKAQAGTNLAGDNLLETLQTTGLILKTSSGNFKLGNIINNKENSKQQVIAIDSGSSILVYPEINFADAIKLSSFLDIRETSTVTRFELGKDSAIRAFDNNISADEIIELLTKLGGRCNDTLIWNLKDWEKRHKEVSLKKGVILQLSQEHHYLTETKPFKALIKETLAPGVYLLNENVIDDAAEVLRKAGIDIIARRKEKIADINKFSLDMFPSPSASTSLKNNSFPVVLNPETENNVNANASRYLEIKQKHLSLLGKMQLSGLEKAELSARIERRLVLSETQLKDVDIRYEKLEARHMDYTGKQNIAKQAVSQQSPLEIIWTVKNKEKTIFSIPKSLEKSGSDLILVIDNERIPLAKISLMRRIKKSIFEK